MKTFRLLVICIIASVLFVFAPSSFGRTHVSVHVGYHGPVYHHGYHSWHHHGYWVGWHPFVPVVVAPPIVVGSPVVVAPSPVVVEQPVVVSSPAPVYYSAPAASSYNVGFQVPDYDGLNAAGAKMRMQSAAPAQQVQSSSAVTPASVSVPLSQAAQQGAASSPKSQADMFYDDAVKAFGRQDYAGAAEKLKAAVRLCPDDMEIPFVYAQALFAANDYEKAAAVLSTVLTEMNGPRQQRDVFFARGLYSDESILQGQVKNLQRAVSMDPRNIDLRLLLGYELLGTGKLDEAREALAPAVSDKRTTLAAGALVNVLDRVKQSNDPNGVRR